MCGIAGLLTLERPVDAALVASVLRMMDAQTHRGPDDWGLLLPEEALQDPEVRALLESLDRTHIRTYPGSAAAPAAVLGARRLSIIDLSPRGRMPMGSGDGRIWLTYNGEIYNFQELRDELKRQGYSFFSDTDTEAILHGYEAWGEDVVHHLRGMFAFTILDTRGPDGLKLFLAKDRFGMKPLYWARKDSVFQFASEVRALMAGGLVPNEPEPRGLHGFLVYGSVPTPLTTVRDVFSLPAAHCLTINSLTYSYPKPKRYWSLPELGSVTLGHEEAARETRRLLDESVRMHLVSDVPVGIFLSGGVDSSTIAALAAKHLPKPPTTLCVSFDDKEFSEGNYAAQVARRFGCRHIDLRLQSREFVEEIPHILSAMDQPSVDGVNTYFVAKAARTAGLTVVLSGLGGDELFWGYRGFRVAPRLARLMRVPGARLGASVAYFLGKLAGYDRWEKLKFVQTPGPMGAYLAIRGLFPPGRAAALLSSGALPLWSPAFNEGLLTASKYAEMEISFYLQNQLLRDSDIFGMAHSIEIRLPFLDHRLVEFVFGLRASVKASGAVSKSLLVSAMGETLGPEVTGRRKMGFIFPFERWMREHGTEIRRETENPGPVDVRHGQAVWDTFMRGKIHWSRPWALAVLSGIARLGVLPALPERKGPERILFLFTEMYASKGGMQVYNQNLIRAAGESFPQCEIRVISMNGKTLPISSSELGRIHFTGCNRLGPAFRKLLLSFSALRETFCHVPDLIICGHMRLTPMAWLASKLSGAPIALIAHGIEVWNPERALRWLVRRVHRVVPVSRFTADQMAAWGVQRGCMRLLPDTVDGEVYRLIPNRKAKSWPSLLTVGRLNTGDRLKGVDLVLDALRAVSVQHPGVRYLIAGEGDDRLRLEARAREIGVANQAEFLGFVPDEGLPRLFNDADLFVMPSQKEGFGIVFLEALACGLPVIAGSRDGSSDPLLDGRIGLLVDPQHSSQVVESICSFLDGTANGYLRDPVGLRQEVLSHYGYDRFRRRVRDVIMEAWETAQT